MSYTRSQRREGYPARDRNDYKELHRAYNTTNYEGVYIQLGLDRALPRRVALSSSIHTLSCQSRPGTRGDPHGPRSGLPERRRRPGLNYHRLTEVEVATAFGPFCRSCPQRAAALRAYEPNDAGARPLTGEPPAPNTPSKEDDMSTKRPLSVAMGLLAGGVRSGLRANGTGPAPAGCQRSRQRSARPVIHAELHPMAAGRRWTLIRDTAPVVGPQDTCSQVREGVGRGNREVVAVTTTTRAGPSVRPPSPPGAAWQASGRQQGADGRCQPRRLRRGDPRRTHGQAPASLVFDVLSACRQTAMPPRPRDPYRRVGLNGVSLERAGPEDSAGKAAPAGETVKRVRYVATGNPIRPGDRRRAGHRRVWRTARMFESSWAAASPNRSCWRRPVAAGWDNASRPDVGRPRVLVITPRSAMARLARSRCWQS